MPPDSVHFNGSVNLPDTETVMREISSRIPRGVRRMTDGETGERNYWIMFQVQKFGAMPELQPAGMREVPGGDMPPMPLLRLAGGVAAEDVRWPDLGYAAAYAGSYEIFRRLQDDGTIPSGVRFQLQYPTPLAPIPQRSLPRTRNSWAPPTRPRCSPTLTARWHGCRTSRSPCNGTSPASSRCSKAASASSTRSSSGRSHRDWPAA